MPDAKGYEDLVSTGINQMLDPMAKAVAAGMGMPPGGTKYTQADIDNEWSYSPLASPEMRVQAMLELKALGKTDEEITDAVYPNRRRLIATGRPNIKDQISFAQSQAKRMEKLAAEMGMQMPPAPEQGAGPQVQGASLSPDPGVPSLPPAPEMAPPPAPVQPAPVPASPLDLPATALLGG